MSEKSITVREAENGFVLEEFDEKSMERKTRVATSKGQAAKELDAAFGKDSKRKGMLPFRDIDIQDGQ